MGSQVVPLLTMRVSLAARAVLAVLAFPALLAVLAMFPGRASACPSCPTSRQVNAIVCGEGVWRNLAMTVAPFVVFAAVGWFLHRAGHSSRGRTVPATGGRPDTLAKAEET